MNGVTSPIRRKKFARLRAASGQERVWGVRSLWAMLSTTGTSVTYGDVLVLGADRMSSRPAASVFRGDRKPAAVSRRAKVRLPEE